MFTPRPPTGAHLVIRSPDMRAHTTRVWLNGQEISRCLQAVTLKLTGDDVTRAELTIAVDHIDIDAQTLAALTTLVRAKPTEEAVV
jgi:hypothetical protein